MTEIALGLDYWRSGSAGLTVDATYDECVLHPAGLRDLRLATTGLYRAHWSSDILDQFHESSGWNVEMSPKGAKHSRRGRLDLCSDCRCGRSSKV